MLEEKSDKVWHGERYGGCGGGSDGVGGAWSKIKPFFIFEWRIF